MKALAIQSGYLGLVGLLVGCGATETNDRCLFTDLAEISARTNEIAVGDTLTLQATLVQDECLPANLEPAEWRWSSSDTIVVRIDSLTGVARGAGSGTTTILVQHARAPGVQGSTQIEVTAGTMAGVRRILGSRPER